MVFCHFTWHLQDAHFLCTSLFKQFKESNLLNRVFESTQISWCLKFLFAFQNHLGNQHRLQNRAACFSFKIISDFFLRENNCFLLARKAKQTVIKLFIFPIHRAFSQNSSSTLHKKIMNRNKNNSHESCSRVAEHPISSTLLIVDLEWRTGERSLSAGCSEPVFIPTAKTRASSLLLFQILTGCSIAIVSFFSFVCWYICRESIYLQVIFWGMACSLKLLFVFFLFCALS